MGWVLPVALFTLTGVMLWLSWQMHRDTQRIKAQTREIKERTARIRAETERIRSQHLHH